MGQFDAYKMTPGQPRWGTEKYNPGLDAVDAALATKAPLPHGHDGSTGTVAMTVCTSVTRPATPTLGMQIVETDTGYIRRCTSASPAAWSEPLQEFQPAKRHDHASYIALRPSGAGSWATLVTGEAGKLKLVCPYVAHSQVDWTIRTGGLSQDGGVTYNVDFDVASGFGVCALGALVVDADSVILAGRSGNAADLAYWAEVLDAPQGVTRLSGVPAGAAMLAVPLYTSSTTMHTATKRERVSIYAGRASGTTETQWLILQGNTSQGDDTLIVVVAMEAKAPPALIWTGVLNAGEAIKICSSTTGKFWAWGFAQEVEA